MNNDIRELASKPVPELPTTLERVRLRNRFGVTQQQAANALKVSRRSFGAWESGKATPTGENRVKYAELLALWQERERDTSEN